MKKVKLIREEVKTNWDFMLQFSLLLSVVFLLLMIPFYYAVMAILHSYTIGTDVLFTILFFHTLFDVFCFVYICFSFGAFNKIGEVEEEVYIKEVRR